MCRLQCRGAEQEGGDITGQTQAEQRCQVARTGGVCVCGEQGSMD